MLASPSTWLSSAQAALPPDGPRQQQPHRLLGPPSRAAHAAIRLHEQQARRAILGLHSVRQLVDIARHHRHQQGVEHRRRGALVLANLGIERTRAGHPERGPDARQTLGDARLVL
jgi:hypothetical protein